MLILAFESEEARGSCRHQAQAPSQAEKQSRAALFISTVPLTKLAVDIDSTLISLDALIVN